METNEKPTIKARLLNLLYKILSIFGLMTNTQHDIACAAIEALNESKLTILQNKVDYSTKAAESLKEENEKLLKAIGDMSEKYKALEGKIDAYKSTASVNLDYVKGTQKSLSEFMSGQRDFSFPRTSGIPGSSAFVSETKGVEDEEYVDIRTRTIMPDDVTAHINNNPDMATRINLTLRWMEQYEIYKRIGKTLVDNGAVSLVLGYNNKCTNYELYTEVIAKNAAKDVLLQIEGPLSTINKTVDKSE